MGCYSRGRCTPATLTELLGVQLEWLVLRPYLRRGNKNSKPFWCLLLPHPYFPPFARSAHKSMEDLDDKYSEYEQGGGWQRRAAEGKEGNG
ncbi:hypothetical protein ZWY2020_047916 [Hordeum vulgare]|nr:hypothetical protein ZWY2020_047916 [Hordeum vulgare]